MTDKYWQKRYSLLLEFKTLLQKQKRSFESINGHYNGITIFTLLNEIGFQSKMDQPILVNILDEFNILCGIVEIL